MESDGTGMQHPAVKLCDQLGYEGAVVNLAGKVGVIFVEMSAPRIGGVRIPDPHLPALPFCDQLLALYALAELR